MCPVCFVTYLPGCTALCSLTTEVSLNVPMQHGWGVRIASTRCDDALRSPPRYSRL